MNHSNHENVRNDCPTRQRPLILDTLVHVYHESVPYILTSILYVCRLLKKDHKATMPSSRIPATVTVRLMSFPCPDNIPYLYQSIHLQHSTIYLLKDTHSWQLPMMHMAEQYHLPLLKKSETSGLPNGQTREPRLQRIH